MTSFITLPLPFLGSCISFGSNTLFISAAFTLPTRWLVDVPTPPVCCAGFPTLPPVFTGFPCRRRAVDADVYTRVVLGSHFKRRYLAFPVALPAALALWTVRGLLPHIWFNPTLHCLTLYPPHLAPVSQLLLDTPHPTPLAHPLPTHPLPLDLCWLVAFPPHTHTWFGFDETLVPSSSVDCLLYLVVTTHTCPTQLLPPHTLWFVVHLPLVQHQQPHDTQCAGWAHDLGIAGLPDLPSI